MVAEFEPREIDFVLRHFGKVDAGEHHPHVLIGPPPCVPLVLALRREVKEECLDVFVVLLFCGRLIPRRGLVAVRHA
jgi:8-oxo-dGTP pyrophosphatase MutT (NUDIX family)